MKEVTIMAFSIYFIIPVPLWLILVSVYTFVDTAPNLSHDIHDELSIAHVVSVIFMDAQWFPEALLHRLPAPVLLPLTVTLFSSVVC